MSDDRGGLLRPGVVRVFSPNALGDPNIRAALGHVKILERVKEKKRESGVAALYRVKNLANGTECHAFGDELLSA